MLKAPRQVTNVTGWNDTNLHVSEWGDPDGQPLVLLHGWSQAHPCWARQLAGALDTFRLVAPDLRGHGRSDKPLGAEHYNHRTPWANDVAAILSTLELDDAILVGWSMGGWVVQDYLTAYGEAQIAGYCLVGSSSMTGRHLPLEARAKRNDPALKAPGMYSGALAEELSDTLGFVRACFHQQPDADTLAQIVGYNMLCPQHVRDAARDRHEIYHSDLAHLTVPALILWGRHERLAVPPMPEMTVDALPNATACIYEDSGHSPFWEEADRFNADIAQFAATCSPTRAIYEAMP